VGAVDPRTPCIIGVAQDTWHLAGDEQAPEPLAMLTQVVAAAAGDAQATGDVLGAVDLLRVVYCMSWPYDDPAGRLAEAVGMNARDRGYTGIGGTVPQQTMWGDAATAILAGRSDVAVVTGAEALDTVRRLKKAGERPAWSHRDPEKKPFPYEAPFHPSEIAHEVFQAWLTFAVRDIARRGRLGVEPDAYRRQMGELLAPMTEVAAKNPYAWFQEVHDAEALITPSRGNRMIGYPYTKQMVSIMDVDMAAAVIVASHEAADRLGVPPERRAYLRSSAYMLDATYVAEHPDLSRSPAMAAVYRSVLDDYGVGIDDVAHLDLYSCFASSLHFAADAIGIDLLADERVPTVTGGLPFAGGAASNYLSHALATMVGVLREDPGSIGLVSGVGMHMTKHGAATYSTEPGPVSIGLVPMPAAETVPIADHHDGPATVAAYSVVHGRELVPEWALLVVDLPGDTPVRAYARVEDADDLAALEAEEWVGRTVTLTADGDVNRARL
jgi:acetyl-CoA C-acetyltransferase